MFKINIRKDKDGKVYVIQSLHIGCNEINRNNKPHEYSCINLENGLTFNLEKDFVKSLACVPLKSSEANNVVAKVKSLGYFCKGVIKLNCVQKVW